MLKVALIAIGIIITIIFIVVLAYYIGLRTGRIELRLFNEEDYEIVFENFTFKEYYVVTDEAVAMAQKLKSIGVTENVFVKKSNIEDKSNNVFRNYIELYDIGYNREDQIYSVKQDNNTYYVWRDMENKLRGIVFDENWNTVELR